MTLEFQAIQITLQHIMAGSNGTWNRMKAAHFCTWCALEALQFIVKDSQHVVSNKYIVAERWLDAVAFDRRTTVRVKRSMLLLSCDISSDV
jgi:hypothetical protein